MPEHVGQRKTRQFAVLDCPQPSRGKSQAIQHNSALPKVRKSLRRGSLDDLPLHPLRVTLLSRVLRQASLKEKCLGGTLQRTPVFAHRIRFTI